MVGCCECGTVANREQIVSVLTFDSKRAYDWANVCSVLGFSVFVVFSGESVFILEIFFGFFLGLVGIGFPVVRQGEDARSIRQASDGCA